jgi:hypothetical protein
LPGAGKGAGHVAGDAVIIKRLLENGFSVHMQRLRPPGTAATVFPLYRPLHVARH